MLCLMTLTLCQTNDDDDAPTDIYDDINSEAGDDIYGDDISDPYDIPILSDNIVRTEPQQQQEVLPLLSENIIDETEVTDPEDMCRVANDASNIVLDIVESLNDDFSQMTSPSQLPITGVCSSVQN